MALFRVPRFQTYVMLLCIVYLFVMVLFHLDMQTDQPNKPNAILKDQEVYPPMKRTLGPVEPSPKPDPVMTNANYRGFKNNPSPEIDSELEVKHVNYLKIHSHDTQCVGLNNGKEFEFSELVSDSVQVFSAYWDDRPNDFDNKHNGTHVRIMALIRSAALRPTIVCKFPMDNGQNHLSLAHYYEMCENHGRPFGGFIISCPVPNEVGGQPCSVELSEDRGKIFHTLRVLPMRPREKEPRHKFGICVPPLYGDINNGKLVEFIELSKLLGANRIIFYDYKISAQAASALEYYQSEGTVVVIPWRFPDRLAKYSWYHGQMAAIQDCLYRSMHTTEYVVFNDIDEFLVPRKHPDWATMVDAMFQPDQCAQCFHSAFYPPKNMRNGTVVLSSLRRSMYYSGTRTKCMVKPYQIYEKGIHHVSKPIWATLQVVKTPPQIAFIRHYRNCMRDFAMNCKEYVDDNTISIFANDIKINSKLVLDEL